MEWYLITVLAIAVVGLSVGVWFAYRKGQETGITRVRRLVKKREGNRKADDFILQPAEDGAMEVLLTRSSFKRLQKRENIEGLLAGDRNKMVFRIVRV